MCELQTLVPSGGSQPQHLRPPFTPRAALFAPMLLNAGSRLRPLRVPQLPRCDWFVELLCVYLLAVRAQRQPKGEENPDHA